MRSQEEEEHNFIQHECIHWYDCLAAMGIAHRQSETEWIHHGGNFSTMKRGMNDPIQIQNGRTMHSAQVHEAH